MVAPPRLALLANPAAGGASEAAAALLASHGADVRVVTRVEDLLEAATGAERMVVAGGDGSIGPATAVAADLDLPLAVIPAGTANDFARAMALPERVEDACRLAVLGTELRAVDLCRMDHRPFVNAANAGLAAAAGRHAAPLKSRLGPLAYAVGALRAGAGEQPFDCRITADGDEAFSGRAWQVVIAGSGAFGAGSEIGGADPQDGLLDVATFVAGSRLALVRRAYGLRTGTVERQSGVEHQRAREVGFEGDVDFNVDGELVRASGCSRFTVAPQAFELVVG